MIANPNDIATYAATAHIPGAIPDKTCRQCAHLVPCSNKNRGRCLKHFAFRGLDYLFKLDEPGWWHGLASIPASMPACKYFWEKADEPGA